MVAVCRYQYEQWKRGGHLHNKAINGILNHKTVILPDPEIKREREQEQKTQSGREKEIAGKREERRQREPTSLTTCCQGLSSAHYNSNSHCVLLRHLWQKIQKRGLFYKSGCNFSKEGYQMELAKIISELLSKAPLLKKILMLK